MLVTVSFEGEKAAIFSPLGEFGRGISGIAVKLSNVTVREETGFILAPTPPPIIGRGAKEYKTS